MDLEFGKRQFGLVLMVVVLSAFSGCSALGGGGSGCGPGADKIKSLEQGDTGVTLTGEVVKTGPGSFAIDDGTGKAMVMSGKHDVEEGTCVTVDGRVQMTYGDGQKVDAAVAVTNVTEA